MSFSNRHMLVTWFRKYCTPVSPTTVETPTTTEQSIIGSQSNEAVSNLNKNTKFFFESSKEFDNQLKQKCMLHERALRAIGGKRIVQQKYRLFLKEIRSASFPLNKSNNFFTNILYDEFSEKVSKLAYLGDTNNIDDFSCGDQAYFSDRGCCRASPGQQCYKRIKNKIDSKSWRNDTPGNTITQKTKNLLDEKDRLKREAINISVTHEIQRVRNDRFHTQKSGI